jgi:hypothetical protein
MTVSSTSVDAHVEQIPVGPHREQLPAHVERGR